MIPEGYEAIKENLAPVEVLMLQNAMQQVSMAEKDLQISRLVLQNAGVRFGAEGDFVLLEDKESDAYHLVRRKVEIPDAPVLDPADCP